MLCYRNDILLIYIHERVFSHSVIFVARLAFLKTWLIMLILAFYIIVVRRELGSAHGRPAWVVGSMDFSK